jgi:tRNA-specific 2-thiouridylase
MSAGINLKNINLNETISDGDTAEAQTRYRQRPFQVKVKSVNSSEIILEILDETDGVALGQSCVLYRGPVCLGGGIIS